MVIQGLKKPCDSGADSNSEKVGEEGDKKQTSLPTQMIQHHHISICVIKVIGIWWIIFFHPIARQGTVQVEDVVLWLGLIVYAIKSVHLPIQNPEKERKGEDENMPVTFGTSRIFIRCMQIRQSGHDHDLRLIYINHNQPYTIFRITYIQESHM